MRKLFATMLLASSLALCGCDASLSSGSVKSGLESAGYSTQMYNEAEAKAAIQGVKYNVTVKEALYAHKAQGDVILCFFCGNIDDASAFVQENISAMNYWSELPEENRQIGSHNNVAYAGSKAAVRAAGIPVSE